MNARLKRIEKAGYSVTNHMNGSGVSAVKNGRRYNATSVTALHKVLFGY